MMIHIESTTITLSKMHFYAYHGVMPHEQKVGNDYEVTLSLAFSASQAMWSDSLEDTINYAEVFSLVKEIMSQKSQLLENVAGRILESLKQNFPQISGATCAITKLTPPIPTFDASGVTFTATATW